MKSLSKRDYQDWIEWRRKGIGGSDAPAIMKTSLWTDPAKLLGIKTGRIEPDPPTYIMRRGLWQEKYARAEYERLTGIEMPVDYAQHPEIPYVRGSFDGFNKEANKATEIKCPGKKDHRIALKGEVPGHYVWQLVHLMLVKKLPEIDYFSYYKNDHTGETNSKIIPFKHNARMENELVKAEKAFWRQVMKELKTNTKSPYSAKEVVEILQIAKQLGCLSLRLEGFEVAWEVQKCFEPAAEEVEVPTPRMRRAARTNVELCEDCGAPKIQGEFSLYCKPCFIEKKDAEQRSRRKVQPFRVARFKGDDGQE